MRDEQDFFQIEIMDSKTVYACNICDEGFEHMKEIEEHVVISHKDILTFVSAKEADENAVHESEEDFETHNVILKAIKISIFGCRCHWVAVCLG